jgi:hypothetical protein
MKPLPQLKKWIRAGMMTMRLDIAKVEKFSG